MNEFDEKPTDWNMINQIRENILVNQIKNQKDS